MSMLHFEGSNGGDVYIKVPDYIEGDELARLNTGVVMDGQTAGTKEVISYFKMVGKEIVSECADIFESFKNSIQDINLKNKIPTEVSVEFSVSILGKTSYLGLLEASGTFKVKAKWIKDS